jgi:hypothetical protein
MNSNSNSVVLVRKRTIPTERPQPAGEVSANLADRGCCVVSTTDPHGRNLGFLDPEPLLFHSSNSSVILTSLSGPRSRPTTSQKIWVLHELVKFNENRSALFQKIAALYFGAHLKGPIFLELECLYSPSTDLKWTDS